MAHGRINRRAFCAAVASPLLLPALGCRRPPPWRREIDARAPADGIDVAVDVRAGTGRFDRLSGVQGSPAPIVAGEPDYTAGFRAHHIERVRFPQDCEPNTLTLGGIFPDEGADPTLPGSYRFEAVDRHVAAARAAGAEILWQSSYDVGRSDRWVGFNLGGRAPTDLDRWERVVERCLAHFNDGWAGGSRDAVAFVEYVNEPNGLGGFKGADAPRLVPAFLRFLASIDLIGRARPGGRPRAVGPGIPLSFSEWDRGQPHFEELMRALRAAGRPLPVFSFHTYGADVSPVANARLARAFREGLDASGLRDTELWNTEWQAGDFLREHLGVERERAAEATADELRTFASGLAAYALACKIRWQGLLTGSFYYRANRRAFAPGFEPPPGAGGPTAFFTRTGGVGPLALQEGLTDLAARATPHRCRTDTRDDALVTVLGLRGDDAHTAGLLVSSLATAPRRIRVTFSGLEPDGRAAVRAFRIDGRRQTLSPERRAGGAVVRGRLALETTLAPLSSELLLVDVSPSR